MALSTAAPIARAHGAASASSVHWSLLSAQKGSTNDDPWCWLGPRDKRPNSIYDSSNHNRREP